jgi:hypothetical protein
LIGRGGVASLHLASKFSVSHDDVYVISTKNNIDYVYHYLMCNKDLISNSFKGSTIKHSSKCALYEIKIKIPKNKQLISDLEPLFKQIEDLQKQIKDDDKLFKQYIEELKNEAIPEQTDNIQQPQPEEQENNTETASNVSSKSSLKDLKEQCKSLGIKGYSKLNKEQLIEKIKNHNP